MNMGLNFLGPRKGINRAQRRYVVVEDTDSLSAVERLPVFEEVFIELYPSFVNTLRMVVRDGGVAEDLAQESFAQAFVRWSEFESKDHVRNFVFKVGLNRARSYRRSARRFLHRADSVEGRATSDPQGEVEVRLLLEQALATLSWRQRSCLVLVDYFGLEPDNVARILRIRPATVYVHLHRARKGLRDRLDRSLQRERRPSDG